MISRDLLNPFIQKCRCRCTFVSLGHRYYNSALELSPQKEHGRKTSRSVRTQFETSQSSNLKDKQHLKKLDEFKKKLRAEKFTQIQVIPKVSGPPVPSVSSVPSKIKEMGDIKTTKIKKQNNQETNAEGKTHPITRNFQTKLQHLITRKQYSEVLREFDRFLLYNPEHLNRNIYKLVLHAHVHSENLPRAEKYFQNVQKINEIDTTMYNMMIRMLTQNGKTEEARKLLEEMKKNDETVPGVDTFTTFLTHYGINGKIKEMKEILFEMRAMEIELDTRMFCSLMTGLVKNGEEDEGLLLFETMKSQKIKPTTQCYNLAMSVHSQRGDMQKTFQLFEEMKKYYLMPDNDTCVILMRSYEKENIPAALGLYEELKKFLQVTPNLSHIAIRMYRSQKEFTKAEEVWTEFKNSSKKGTSYLYTEVMKLFHMINSLPKAMELYSYVKNTEFFNISLCNPLMSLYILNGKDEEAFELMKEIKKRELIPSPQTFQLFFRLYIRADMVVEAKESFEQMKSLGLGMSYTTYNALAEMFQKHGQNENAGMVLEEAARFLTQMNKKE